VMIAMALSCDPLLLIADEPTTALDVTIQAQILDLMKKLQQERGTAVILITHDLGVVAGMADRVQVMYAGTIAETADTYELFGNPRLLIADEPTTALDVTIQAQILELLKKLQADYGMAILMITHNLGVIAEMANRVAVMYMGKIVEMTEARTIFNEARHPYTVGLLRSLPKVGKDVKQRLASIPGSVPDPFNLPKGCSFYPRCPAPKRETCLEPVPLYEVGPGHSARCTLYEPGDRRVLKVLS